MNKKEALAAEILAYATEHNVRPGQAILVFIKDGRVKEKEKSSYFGIISQLVRRKKENNIPNETKKPKTKTKTISKENDNEDIDEDIDEDIEDNNNDEDEFFAEVKTRAEIVNEADDKAPNDLPGKTVVNTKKVRTPKKRLVLPDNLPSSLFQEKVVDIDTKEDDEEHVIYTGPQTITSTAKSPAYSLTKIELVKPNPPNTNERYIINPNYKPPTNTTVETQTNEVPEIQYIETHQTPRPEYVLKQPLQEPTHNYVTPTSHPGDAKDIITESVNRALNKSYSAAFQVISEKIFVDTHRRAQFEAWASAYNYPDSLGDFLVDCFDEFMKLRGVELEIVIRNPVMNRG